MKFLKKMIIIFTILIAALAIGTYLFMQGKQFGGLPSGKRLERILKSASQPVKYTEDTTLVVSASIGISFYRIDNQANIKELLTQADNAMYEAKKKGKNCFSIYQETPY